MVSCIPLFIYSETLGGGAVDKLLRLKSMQGHLHIDLVFAFLEEYQIRQLQNMTGFIEGVGSG